MLVSSIVWVRDLNIATPTTVVMAGEPVAVVKHSVHTLVFRSLKRTHDMFLSEEGQPVQEDEKA